MVTTVRCSGCSSVRVPTSLPTTKVGRSGGTGTTDGSGPAPPTGTPGTGIVDSAPSPNTRDDVSTIPVPFVTTQPINASPDVVAAADELQYSPVDLPHGPGGGPLFNPDRAARGAHSSPRVGRGCSLRAMRPTELGPSA